MKAAVTSQGQEWNSPVDPRFGRARFFIVVDTEREGFSVVDNTVNLNSTQGAGIQAGKKVVGLGVKAVVTGHVGPKALAILRAGGVRVYTRETGTVAEAVEQLKAGKLVCQDDSDVEGNWFHEEPPSDFNQAMIEGFNEYHRRISEIRARYDHHHRKFLKPILN